jgi:carboxyl-terminal processing protease
MKSLSASASPSPVSRLFACAVATLVTLAGCGGGGGNPNIGASTPVADNPGTGTTTPTPPTTTPTPSTGTPDPIPSDYISYQNLCAAPRTGVDAGGYAFPDRQGTLQDEMKFLRGWTDATYLWYNEIPATVHMADYTNTLDYFDALKTQALTASGKPKDRFHFTYTTAEWDALSNASQDTGYGLTWSVNSTTAPRTWIAAIVEPGSPAAAAGIQRGDLLAAVDGIDFINTTDKAQVALLNDGLSPDTAGERHTLTLRRGDTTTDVALTSAVVTTTPVKNQGDRHADRQGRLPELRGPQCGVRTAADRRVHDPEEPGRGRPRARHALQRRRPAVHRQRAGLHGRGTGIERQDVRAPASTTTRRSARCADPVPQSTAYGFSPHRRNMALPYLGLKRVTVLTTSGTCSASEAVINGLRGVDVQVNLIGGQTCGKPYGFTPVDNCGTTYFSIEFQGVNAKGFGDFADGFAPTCAVADDLAHALGDPAEALLAARCPTAHQCLPGSSARDGAARAGGVRRCDLRRGRR